MTGYEDILDAERPRSPKHPPMKREDRAKQFMPFATLRGYGDILSDREVTGVTRAEDDDAVEALNEALMRLTEQLEAGHKPLLRIEIYKTDQSLRTFMKEVTGKAEKLSLPERTLRIDGEAYSLDDIKSVDFQDEDE